MYAINDKHFYTNYNCLAFQAYHKKRKTYVFTMNSCNFMEEEVIVYRTAH